MANGTISPADVQEVLPETSSALSLEDVSEIISPEGSTFQASDISEVLPSELTVGEFKQKPEEELIRDKDFSPVLFGAKNREALLSDPESLNKLIRLYQQSETRGTTLAEKGKALITGLPVAGKAILKGAKAAVERGLELSPLEIPRRGVKAIAKRGVRGVGELVGELAKETAETAASIELAGESTADLLRRSGRAVKEGITGLFGAGKKALTPEEWRSRFFDDVAGVEQTEKVAQGNGPVLQALQLDADQLKGIGIELDPAKIEELSAATDPINFIPFGAAVGVVSKVGGKLTQKVIAKTLSAEQAVKLAESLNKARDVASSGATLAAKAAGRVTRAAGAGLEKVGEVSEKVIRSVGGAGAGVGLGGIIGGDIYSGLAGAAAAKGVPKTLRMVGRGVTAVGEALSGIRPVPGVISAAVTGVSEAAKGVSEGLLLSVPFEIGARPEEEQAILGAAGLGGVGRVGVKAIPAAGRLAAEKAQDILAETIFRQVDQSEPPVSGIYGTDPNLDTAHSATIQSLDPRSQKLVNWTRELFRDSGVEIYSVDNETFRSQSGTGNAHGFAIDIGETVDVATGQAKPLIRVFLNSSTEALPHELFHALESLDPKGAETLKKSVSDGLTPEQKKSFETYYNTLRNDGRPESAWTIRLSPEAVASELGAEVFSRIFLGQDLSGVARPIQQNAALFLSSILEKIGAPLGGVGKAPGPGISTLGVRPGVESIKVGRDWIQNIIGRIESQGNILPETPVKSKVFAGVRPEDISISRRPVAEAPVRAPEITTPPALRPPLPAPRITPPNIRVTREQQGDFAARRAEETGIEKARSAAKDPAIRSIVDQVNFDQVFEIEHRGVRTVSTPEEPLGRTSRRAEQEAAYIAEGLGAAPESVRSQYQKVFVPVRWEIVGEKPQLIAMSLDKVIANVHRAVKDSVAKGVGEKIPYEISEGKLTEAGWKQVVQDLQSYSENQSKGYRGDGKKLTRPKKDIGVSIPAEDPNYNPVEISEDRALFLNLVQGLNPPLTARVVKSGLPGNVKAQIIAELNLREPQRPSVIRAKDIEKQAFKAPPEAVGRVIRETNPLRNELATAGVSVRELIEVTERINAEDVTNLRPRPELKFSAPVTDIIRGGFLPGKETMDAIRTGLLRDRKPSVPIPSPEIRKIAEDYVNSAGIPYSPGRIFSSVDSDLAKRIADFYEDAVSNPSDPEIRDSYEALTNETLAQYRAIEAAGYRIEPFAGQGEPYRNSAEAVSDIRDNKHLFFLRTEGVFGGGAERPDNPMLSNSGIQINGQSLLVNDVFRSVHDFFGHGKEGYQFGPRGEFNAWRAHSEMFSPRAQGALAAETLAQNSWVNFGHHLRDAKGNIPQKGEPGHVPLTERRFAEQKNVVIPDSLIQEARNIANREGKFLPDNKSVEEYGNELLSTNSDDWRKVTQSMDGGLTGGAWDLGLGLKDRSDLEVLNRLQSDARKAFDSAVEKSNWEDAQTAATKIQFFREAYEAATGTGSAKMGLEKQLGADYRPPFRGEETFKPITDLPTVEKSFLPASEFPTDVDPITEAAIRLPSGRIFTGGWHGEAISKIVEAAGRGEIDARDITPGGNQFDVDFGTDGFLTRSGKFLDRTEALEHARSIKQLREEGQKAREFGGLESKEFEQTRAFLPRARKTRVKAEDIRKTEDPFAKYNIDFDKAVARRKAREAGKSTPLTSWILPNNEIVPLRTAFHEGYLAENSETLNQRFGTDFSSIEDVDQRLNALNKGFVRVRYEQPTGTLNVEANFERWNPKSQSQIEKIATENEDDLSNLRITLLNNKGEVVDSNFARLFEFEGTEKFDRIAEAIRAVQGKQFLPSGKLPDSVSPIVGERKSYWLSPNGKFYDAEDHHLGWAKKYLGILESESSANKVAEETGWVRVQTYSDGGIFASKNLNRTQRSVLEDFAFEVKRPVLDIDTEKSLIESTEEFGQFLPSGEGELALGLPGELELGQQRIARRVRTFTSKFPEALPPQYAKDDEGNFIVKADGKPKLLSIEYGFADSPLAKEAAKGIRGPDAREDAIAEALANQIVKVAKKAEKNKEIQVGNKWYSTARTRLRNLLEDDSKFFAELLGATSARTPVETNFRFSVDAYNRFKSGKYDSIIKKYREGKSRWESGEIEDFIKETKNENPTRGQFLDWWVDKHDLKPRQSNGKLFASNSRAVLRVLDGTWSQEVQGPKTPNFAGNLSGQTFEATIDVWAARLLHRLSNEGNSKRWRILPENETGVTDSDFFLGQKAFRKAADRLKMKPDALQAILWFFEKDHWEKNGWTRGAGAEKSDFSSLLGETEKTKEGVLRSKIPQKELALGVGKEDITRKNE